MTRSRGRPTRRACSSRSNGCRRSRRASRSGLTLSSETRVVAGVELTLLRPESPDALIDEAAFDRDEFMPYWAELWPAAIVLAEALPDVRGLRVVELGCGLGVTSLVAAANGA